MDDTEKEPQYFYRVSDNSSRCKYDKDEGFVASIPNAIYDPEHPNAKRELVLHMNWRNRKPTPFISVTSSPEKALQFALKRMKRMKLKNGNVLITKINRSLLSPKCVYHMETLVKRTGVVIKPKAMNSHEYLCVRHIPRSAIVKVTSSGIGVGCG